MNKIRIVTILFVFFIGLSACNDDSTASSSSQPDSSLVPVESSVQQEEALSKSGVSSKAEWNDPFAVSIGGEYQKLPTPDSEATGIESYEVYYMQDACGKPLNLFWSNEDLCYVRYDIETLTYDYGTLFEASPDEFVRTYYIEGERVLVITNRNCYAFDCESMGQIISKPLPEFLVVEEENNEYRGLDVDTDLTVIAYSHRTEKGDSLYICPLTDNPIPVKIHESDATWEDGGHESYYVISFLDGGNLLTRVAGWEWTWRYEIMDRQGNTLLKIQQPDLKDVANYGGGGYFCSETEMLMFTPPVYEEDKKWYQYYHVDYERLEMRQLDWINEKLPPQGAVSIGADNRLIAVSSDLKRGVVCARYLEKYPLVDKTEFYLIDFERETVTMLPQTIENRVGAIFAVVGDYFYFSYCDDTWINLQGVYAAKLPNAVE